jgi:hypothetical protein
MTEQAVTPEPVPQERERRRGHPVTGAIAGLLLGLFVAFDLMMFEVRPVDSLSLFGLPAVGMVLGILLGLWAPFGGRSSERPPA